jgi:DNA-3-methyladenine glycosylase II
LRKIKPAPLSFTLELPKNYRAQEILNFHARDPEQLAERITDTSVTKAIIVNEYQTLINVELKSRAAVCTFQIDDPQFSVMLAQRIIHDMLGLTIAVEPFERKMKSDAFLGALIHRQKGLRIPQAATPFEALTWAIIGQQINLRFAIQLRHTLIKLGGAKHPGGLYCYPDAALVCRLKLEQLTKNKFSRAKGETLLRVASLVMDGTLPLGNWQQSGIDVDTIQATLLNVKGIGPWTAHYTLMRGFGVADCSLHGDVAVRKALAKLGNADATAPTIKEAEIILAQYAPYRSLVAAHLWASLHMSA